MKGNQYRKLHPMSKFARKYFCKKARRNQIRDDKRQLRRIVRRKAKEQIQEAQNEIQENRKDNP